MDSVPYPSNLAGVNAETMPDLYNKMTKAVRRMTGLLPKEKAKGPAIVTTACPDIRNPMVSGIARLAAQAEEERANAPEACPEGHHQDIEVIDANREDTDEDESASVPASLIVGGPARSASPSYASVEAPW